MTHQYNNIQFCSNSPFTLLEPYDSDKLVGEYWYQTDNLGGAGNSHQMREASRVSPTRMRWLSAKDRA